MEAVGNFVDNQANIMVMASENLDLKIFAMSWAQFQTMIQSFGQVSLTQDPKV